MHTNLPPPKTAEEYARENGKKSKSVAKGKKGTFPKKPTPKVPEVASDPGQTSSGRPTKEFAKWEKSEIIYLRRSV